MRSKFLKVVHIPFLPWQAIHSALAFAFLGIRENKEETNLDFSLKISSMIDIAFQEALLIP